MGSMARMSRCERFIGEFGKDVIGQQSLQPGTLLRVVSVSLGMDPINEVVRPYALLRTEGPTGGDEYEVPLDEAVFDPELPAADVIEMTVHAAFPPDKWESHELGKSTIERLTQARLIREE